MLKQMELALAYGCPDSVDSETLVEYIHHNRDLNARQINTLGMLSRSRDIYVIAES